MARKGDPFAAAHLLMRQNMGMHAKVRNFTAKSSASKEAELERVHSMGSMADRILKNKERALAIMSDALGKEYLMSKEAANDIALYTYRRVISGASFKQALWEAIKKHI